MIRTSIDFRRLAEQADTQDYSAESIEDIRNDVLVTLSLIGLLLFVGLGIGALLILA